MRTSWSVNVIDIQIKSNLRLLKLCGMRLSNDDNPHHPHIHDQQVVQEALEVAQQGRTSITIAHRLSTIMESDR